MYLSVGVSVWVCVWGYGWGEGGGGGLNHFFVNCGTFYDYELIALPAPWICCCVFFCFVFFSSQGWYLYFGSSGPHGQSLLYMSHIWARVERAMDSRSIVIEFDFHNKFQANFWFHTASAYLTDAKSGWVTRHNSNILVIIHPCTLYCCSRTTYFA